MRLFVILFAALALTLGSTFSAGLSKLVDGGAWPREMVLEQHARMQAPEVTPGPCSACLPQPGPHQACDMAAGATCAAPVLAALPDGAVRAEPMAAARRLARVLSDRRLRGLGPAPALDPPRYRL